MLPIFCQTMVVTCASRKCVTRFLTLLNFRSWNLHILLRNPLAIFRCLIAFRSMVVTRYSRKPVTDFHLSLYISEQDSYTYFSQVCYQFLYVSLNVRTWSLHILLWNLLPISMCLIKCQNLVLTCSSQNSVTLFICLIAFRSMVVNTFFSERCYPFHVSHCISEHGS
jgi:hypothetical protein